MIPAKVKYGVAERLAKAMFDSCKAILMNQNSEPQRPFVQLPGADQFEVGDCTMGF